MAYKRKIDRKKISGLYLFMLKKHNQTKDPKILEEEREKLRIKVKGSYNSGKEFDDYMDLSYWKYGRKMDNYEFRQKVWAGKI